MKGAHVQLANRESLIRRATRHLLAPIRARQAALEHERTIARWSHHADPRTFKWDWSATNYNRVAVINLLVSKYSDPAYLEIGCSANILFDAVPVLNKVGVDPVTGGTKRMTSDEFFDRNRAKFDVIFVDGLHTYEQVRKDIINAFRCIKEGGWIALHDMLPGTWIDQHVPKLSLGAWNGDVWKIAFELVATEGIEFKILRIDNGVGVVKPLKSNITLADKHAELRDQQFSFFCDNLQTLPVTEWNSAQSWLRS